MTIGLEVRGSTVHSRKHGPSGEAGEQGERQITLKRWLRDRPKAVSREETGTLGV